MGSGSVEAEVHPTWASFVGRQDWCSKDWMEREKVEMWLYYPKTIVTLKRKKEKWKH